MSAAKPGRDWRGRFVSNDATAGRAIDRLADAVELISCRIWLSAADKKAIEAAIHEARNEAELADAGERPTTWPDGSPKEALHPDGYPAEEMGS